MDWLRDVNRRSPKRVGSDPFLYPCRWEEARLATEAIGRTESALHPVVWGEGWHVPEVEGGQPFRWMGARASLRFEAGTGPRYLELGARTILDDLAQRLTAEVAGAAHRFELVQGANVASIEVPPGATEVALSVDTLVPAERHPGDGRELAIQVRPPRLHDDAAKHLRAARLQDARVLAARSAREGPAAVTARNLRFERGFHPPELAGGEVLRWMAREGRLAFAGEDHPRFLELWVLSPFEDGAQSITLASGSAAATSTLLQGWNGLSLPVAPGAGAIDLTAGRLWPEAHHPGDPREFAVLVRPPVLHDDGIRHGHLLRQHANRVRNLEEMLKGAVHLESHPPKLGIDIAGTCNVKPPCVYCEWDVSKEREGDNVELPFNPTTLAEYGPWFDDAHQLVNCSIGEPFMVRSIDALLDAFGARGKVLELTTNGQILTDANIRKLLGRDVHLYVSLDAATPETYARLRNDTLPRILDNLERLIAAKGGPGRLPHVYLVFMPMRANVHEVDAFVELCARLRVDRLMLRPLNPSPGVTLKWDRAGYHYDYQQEILPFQDLVRISGRVAGLCARAGVPLSDQLEFGGALSGQFAALWEQGRREADSVPLSVTMAPPEVPAPSEPAWVPPPPDAAAEPEPPPLKKPICTEPWTGLYILRRGTMPCCYGGEAIAPMADFKQAWNGPLMQEIRRDLAAGRFHKYCFDSPDCPIVRKNEQAHDLGAAQQAELIARRGLDRWKRAGYGAPGRLYRWGKERWRRLAGRG
jgi:sulfatase maturation enzyme AslB (radical SAM superfamily)